MFNEISTDWPFNLANMELLFLAMILAFEFLSFSRSSAFKLSSGRVMLYVVKDYPRKKKI